MDSSFLQAQLGQTRDALQAAEHMRQLAEAEYRLAADKLREIARTILPMEWNDLRREHPESAGWGAAQVADWILAEGQRKVNRLELLASGDMEVQTTELIEERDELHRQLQETQEQLMALDANHKAALDHLASKDVELARLRADVVALRDKASSPGESVQTTDLDRDTAALQALGSHGHCLRAYVAKAIGLEDATTGAARRIFDQMKDRGLIVEDKVTGETLGKSPLVMRLTDLGRSEYKTLFGQDAVESEFDRLLARHKSPEHVLLNLQVRDVLLEAGAQSVDLYPRPITVPGGGTFDVDIVAIVNGKPIYVEAERGHVKHLRPAKWGNYAKVTRDFYVAIPNQGAKSSLLSEIETWAYKASDEECRGIRLFMCQLSDYDPANPWALVKQWGVTGPAYRRD